MTEDEGLAHQNGTKRLSGSSGEPKSVKRVKEILPHSLPASTGNKTKKKKKKKGEDESESESEEDDDATCRFRWTDPLHQYFLSCIFELGLEAASPKKLFKKMMADQELARMLLDKDMLERMFSTPTSGTSTTSQPQKKFLSSHVKSHLQRFRANVPAPKQAFIDQVAVLMQEAKDKHTNDKSNHVATKILNPQFHAYPFSADRSFPGETGNTTAAATTAPAAAPTAVPAAIAGAPSVPSRSKMRSHSFAVQEFEHLHSLDPSLLLTPHLSNGWSHPSEEHPFAGNGFSNNNNNNGVPSAIEKKMQIQTELRQQIECRFQSSMVAPNSEFVLNPMVAVMSPPDCLIDVKDSSREEEDDVDRLFEWLEGAEDLFSGDPTAH